VKRIGSVAIATTSVALVWLTAAARADVKPNGLITNGAVLQQGMPVPIWGAAAEGEKVTVTFQEQTVSTTARDGKWLVRLKPLRAGGPFTMTIAGANVIELSEILVGEVWIASGQSNMAWPVDRSADADAVMAASSDPMLHLFSVPYADAAAPASDVNGAWQQAGPDTIAGFSAVAYCFGRDLRQALNVPVGIINSCVGGTAAQQWTRRSFLASDARLRDAITPNTGGLYNGMIAPLIPYAIRGAIWYQGESNAGAAYQYRTLFPGMIRNWRQDWREGDFPFVFVQLAPFMRINPYPEESQWAELREAQLLTSRRVPRTAMAVITDVGDEQDIHPQQKAPVGARLALAALHVAYGKPVAHTGPVYRSMRIKGRYATLTFDHVGEGLVARGGEPTGFTVAGADRKFYNARARIVSRNQVMVWSASVAHPVAVRFGWANYPVVNLFGTERAVHGLGPELNRAEESLPASPFRTDDFPILTGPK
jgi:sialate O-acetylesterase